MVRVDGSNPLDLARFFALSEATHACVPGDLQSLLESVYAQLPFPGDPLGTGGCFPGSAPQTGVPLRLSDLAVRANVDPRAVATLAAMANLPVENFLNPAETSANIDQTFGAQMSDLEHRAQQTYAVSLIALMAAMQGGSLEDLVRILGADNPASRPLAQAIQQVAQALKQNPPDFNTIRAATMNAEWNMIPYGAGNDFQRSVAEQYFKNAYGIGRPGSSDYYGQGGLGNYINQCVPGAGALTPGQFNGPSSQAGINALRAAQSQVGVREASGCNDGLPAQRYSNGRNEPWCANFVAWTFQQAGNPLPGNQRALASVANMRREMQRAGEFHTGTPQPGDVIFFGNPGNHVGIVESVQNGRVNTIEGNSSNAVSRRSYSLNDSRISGYGRHGGGGGAVANGTPRTNGVGRSPMGRGNVDRLFMAITGQESNGNTNAVNPHSGALGIGQVMPANVRAWSREALGYEISPQQFQNSPDLQRQIVHFKLNQYYEQGLRATGSEREAVRYAAAKWYSGDGNKRNSTRPQTYGAGSYPSIASYSDQVLRRFLNA